MEIRKTRFGTLADGTEIPLYTLTNGDGMTAAITPYGGIVVSLMAPSHTGELADVVLGYDTLEAYVSDTNFFGCIVGRYANRIARGRFTLDGESYELARNDGPNALHGGVHGFHKRVWKAWAKETPDGEPSLELGLLSPHGEEGYPGTLTVTVTYTVRNDQALRIDYTAVSDKPTVVNLTNHSYFNLSGDPASTILDHELMIAADAFTPVDDVLIPTGEIRPVEGTPLDFREMTPIGDRINADYDQIRVAGGLDHNWVVRGEPGHLRLAARVRDPGSRREMAVYTTEPGIQVYSGNMIPPSVEGKDGKVYGRRSALCLETQHFPDSPNQPKFPSTVLRPTQTFRSTTLYKFAAGK